MRPILPLAAALSICAASPAAPDETVEIAAAIDNALAHGWQELHLLVECAGDDGLETVEVFTSGVATWGGERQFELSPEVLTGLLERIRDSGFGGLEGMYGGPGPVRVGEQGIRIPCRVVLTLDGAVKQVAQRRTGEQSGALKGLARGILDVCRRPGLAGVSIASLSVGLEKLGRGEIQPEALRILVHRKPELGSPEEDAEGWLLKIAGRWATTRTYARGVGYGPPTRRRLGEQELTSLLRRLNEEGLESLPPNLYAEDYTDIVVEILGHDKRVQARRFAGMTHETHGRQQERFDRIFAVLSEVPEQASRASSDSGS